jgi:hypothetical protein
VPACVKVWFTDSPVAVPVLSPKLHSEPPASPDVASVACEPNETRSPTFAAAADWIVTCGAVRSSSTPSHLASDLLACSAEPDWLALAGLSGIAASAAITHAHTGPSGAGLAPAPTSAVQVNVVDLPALPGTEQAEV